MRDAGNIVCIFVAFLSFLQLTSTSPINWDSDIIASPVEVLNEKYDALSHYFGKQIQNESLFRSLDGMKNIVGEFEDVPKDR